MYFKPLSEQQRKKIAIDREERAFRSFFVANYKPLENYALIFVKDKHLAEDIVSEVMWKMWHLGTDLLHISAVEYYLMRAIKNKCLNHLRVRQMTYVGHEDLIAYPHIIEQITPEQIMISNETITQIERAIHKLPTKTKQAFLLIKEESYTYKEAAQIMGVSTKTVDRHIQIAIKKLWDILKKKK